MRIIVIGGRQYSNKWSYPLISYCPEIYLKCGPWEHARLMEPIVHANEMV